MTAAKQKKRKANPIWKTIADIIRTEISDGIYVPNTKLPTEAEFVDRFKVNRHTVRRALSSLTDENIIYSRQGSGVYVSASPARYEIGKRVRFHQSIDNEGHRANKETLRLETRVATKEEANELQLEAGEMVHIHEGIAFIDGQPAAHFISAYPASRLPGMADALGVTSSITEAFKKCDISDYVRLETRLAAVLSNATTAMHLNLKSGAPLLRALSLNSDLDGHIIEYGRTWFSGNLIEMIVKNDTI